VGEARRLDLDADPVEEGPGDAGEVASDLGEGAGAGMDPVAEVAARTPVHVTVGIFGALGPRCGAAGRTPNPAAMRVSRDERKAGRISKGGGRTRQGDDSAVRQKLDEEHWL
jgi:hypothetical protein